MWQELAVGFLVQFNVNGKDDFVKIPKKMGPFEEITFAHWVNSTNRDGQWRVFFNNDGWKGGDIHYQLHPNKKIEFPINGNPGGMIRLPIS